MTERPSLQSPEFSSSPRSSTSTFAMERQVVSSRTLTARRKAKQTSRPPRSRGWPRGALAMFFVLTVVLIIALVGSIPKWPYSKGWGYFPSVGLGLVLLVLLILAIMHRL